MNKPEMLPCPFCGGTLWKLYKTRTAARGGGAHSVYIKCQQCHARGPKVSLGLGDNPGRELEEAARAWNKRT